MLRIPVHCITPRRSISGIANTVINTAHVHLTLDTTHATCSKRVDEVKKCVTTDLLLYENFINPTQHETLMKEVDRSFRRTKYQYDHWDGAIRGFRETEKSRWEPENEEIIEIIRTIVFAGEPSSPLTHVLDLAEDGYIAPHVDSVKFTGSTITGLNLLSSAVMRFVHNEDKGIVVDLMLPHMSLYVMKDTVRYEFTHEVLGKDVSYWNRCPVTRQRRVSLLLRNDPMAER